MDCAGVIKYGIVERPPVAPFPTAGDRHRTGLEMTHPIVLGLGIGVGVWRVGEHMPYPYFVHNHEGPRCKQPDVNIITRVLLAQALVEAHGPGVTL